MRSAQLPDRVSELRGTSTSRGPSRNRTLTVLEYAFDTDVDIGVPPSTSSSRHAARAVGSSPLTTSIFAPIPGNAERSARRVAVSANLRPWTLHVSGRAGWWVRPSSCDVAGAASSNRGVSFPDAVATRIVFKHGAARASRHTRPSGTVRITRAKCSGSAEIAPRASRRIDYASTSIC
jgi:hypothetical protein